MDGLRPRGIARFPELVDLVRYLENRDRCSRTLLGRADRSSRSSRWTESLGGEHRNGGQSAVETLEAAGVQHVFCSWLDEMEIYDASTLTPDRYLGARDERSGIAETDGYARWPPTWGLP